MSHTLLIFNELCLDCAKKVLFCVKEMATLKSQIKPARVSANKARLDGKKAKSAALPAAALFISLVFPKKNGWRPLITRPVCAHRCDGESAYR